VDLDQPGDDVREVTSTLLDNDEASHELMLQAVDGRFRAKMALLDSECQERLKRARKIMRSERKGWHA